MKPKPDAITLFDYHECRDWLEEKYDYRERDVAGWQLGRADAEYQDFWHWVVEKTDLENGDTIIMDSSWLDGAEDWQKKILNYYLDEFGADDGQGGKSLHLLVGW